MSDAPTDDVTDEPATPANDARILELVNRYAEQAKTVARTYQGIARTVERYCLGDQWGSIIWRNSQVVVTPDDWGDEEGVDRRYVNVMQNVKLTLASLLTRDRPGVVAKAANETSAFDIAVADTSNRLIRYFLTELDTARHVHQTAVYSCEHGMAGLKVMPDAQTGQVTWTPVTIFNVLVDPRAQDFRKGRFVIFNHSITKEEAEELLERAGIDPDDVNEEPYDNAAGEKLQGVPTLEAWIRPTRDFPQGLYASVIGGRHVVESGPFPFVFGPDERPEYVFPLAMMKMREVRDSAYGATSMADVVPLQRSLNEVNNRLMKLLRASTNPNLLVPALLGVGDESNPQGTNIDPRTVQTIYFTIAQAEAIAQMRWTETPEANPQLYTEREYYREAINDVVGINEVTSGQEGRSISGRAIENIVELDSQKNADASRSLQDMVDDAWAMTLRFVQRDYTPEMLATISSATGVDLTAFMQADIQGANVRLEPRSELDLLTTSMDADADERAAAGLPPLAESERATAHDAASTDAAEQLIEAWRQGQPVEVNPDSYNLDVVLSVIERHQALAMAEGDTQLATELDALATEVRAMQAPADNLQPVPGDDVAAPIEGAPPL